MASHRIRMDVFPATLTVAPAHAENPASTFNYAVPQHPDARTLERVRVIVTQDALLVFKDSPDGPALVFSERLADFTPPIPPHRRRQSSSLLDTEARARTDSGKTLAFKQAGGCGCGSRLKSFNPFAQLAQASSSKDA